MTAHTFAASNTALPDPMKTPLALAVASLCASAALLAQAAPPSTAPATAAKEEAVVLSPFEVNSGDDKGYGGVCSLALEPGGVKLYFGQGATLAKSAPKGLLQGSGTLVRYVAMGAVKDLERPEIEALIAAALTLAKVTLDPSAKGAVVIKADEQKQRAAKARRVRES